MWLLQISLPLSQTPDSFSLQSVPSHLLSAWAECVLDCSPSPICPWMPRLRGPGDAGPLTELGAAQTEQLYRAGKMKEILKSRDIHVYMKKLVWGGNFYCKICKNFQPQKFRLHTSFLCYYTMYISTPSSFCSASCALPSANLAWSM